MGTSKYKSRDRVRLALEHREADKVPIDFGGMRSTGISTIAYNKLREYLDIGDNLGLARMYDFVQQLAYPEQIILDMFNIDAVDASRVFLKSASDWREWVLNDGSKCLIPKYLNIETDKNSTVFLKNDENLVLGKKPKNSLYVDHDYWVYKDLEEIPEIINKNDLKKQMWALPTPEWQSNIFDDSNYEIFIKNIKELYQQTDYAIMLGVGCSLLETGHYLRGMEKFLVDLYIDRKGVKRLLDILTEDYIRLLDRVLQGVGDYVDILVFGDDLGDNFTTFFSREVFQDIFKPRYKKMYDYVHKNSKCKIFLHSCGSVYDFIPDLIEIGLDILNPVQTSARGMEPKKLKKEFGKQITFWGGGCDTKEILPYGSPKEVREDVKKRISLFAEGGGFVFNQIHNVLSDVPPENTIAMLKAANEFGLYKPI